MSAPPHDAGLLRSLRRQLRGRAPPRLPPLIDELELDLVRRYGDGRDVFEAGCGTGLLLREAATVRPLGGRPGSVARHAGAGAGAGAARRAGVAHPRAAAVGVGRPRLQHEGAGPRPADRRRRSPSWRGWSAPAATCCSSSTTPCRCATSPSGPPAPARIAHGTNENHVFTRFDTLARGALATCPPTSSWSASAACAS